MVGRVDGVNERVSDAKSSPEGGVGAINHSHLSLFWSFLFLTFDKCILCSSSVVAASL